MDHFFLAGVKAAADAYGVPHKAVTPSEHGREAAITRAFHTNAAMGEAGVAPSGNPGLANAVLSNTLVGAPALPRRWSRTTDTTGDVFR